MTTFLLIRHAAPELVPDTLAGRLPGVPLSRQGQKQAERLAERLAELPIAAVYSSPLERALGTAEPLAQLVRTEVQCCDSFADIEYGEWSGKRFDELNGDPRWRHWNEFRSGAPLPNGGLMLEVQVRAVLALEELRRRHTDKVVAVVSHSDVIKALITHYLGVSLDLFQRVEISPASFSVLAVYDWGARVVRLNDTSNLPALA
jgi:probable phosphomutase (TIGR03848 family)